MKLRPILLLPLLTAAACANTPEDRMVGIWSLEPKSLTLPDVPLPNIQERLSRFARNIRLKLHSDRQFVLVTSEPVEGKWSLEGQTLKLIPNKGANAGALKGMQIRVEPGEQRMTVRSSTQFGDFAMRLHKSG